MQHFTPTSSQGSVSPKTRRSTGDCVTRSGNEPGQASPFNRRKIWDPSWSSSRQNTRSSAKSLVANHEKNDQSPSKHPNNTNLSQALVTVNESRSSVLTFCQTRS